MGMMGIHFSFFNTKKLQYDWSGKYPSDLTATIDSDDQLTLDWVNNGASTYDNIRIERSVNGGAYSEITNVPVLTNTYSDCNLTPADYSYRIRYKKGSSYSTYSNVASVVENDFYDAINAIMSDDLVYALTTDDDKFITQ